MLIGLLGQPLKKIGKDLLRQERKHHTHKKCMCPSFLPIKIPILLLLLFCLIDIGIKEAKSLSQKDFLAGTEG
jgi:hypothetical protein